MRMVVKSYYSLTPKANILHRVTTLARYSQNTCPFISDVVGQGKVIAGLDHGLIGLCKHSKAYIIIPPHLACKSKHFESNTKKCCVQCSMHQTMQHPLNSYTSLLLLIRWTTWKTRTGCDWKHSATI